VSRTKPVSLPALLIAEADSIIAGSTRPIRAGVPK
jgi:hypothetical protein